MKEEILELTKDCANRLLHYIPLYCRYLHIGAIQKAVKEGELTKEDIVQAFREGLDEWW